MVSDVFTIAALVQQAPALAVAICALAFAAWSFRAHRKALAQAEARLSLSAVRQGKRLGRLEHVTGLLDMRRRITEDELWDRGIRLSYWPPDGPDQPARRDDDDQADDDADGPSTAFRAEIPPLPDMARHRRSSA